MSACILCGKAGPSSDFDQYSVPYWFLRFIDVNYVLVCKKRSTDCMIPQQKRCLPQRLSSVLSSKSSDDFNDIVDAKAAISKLMDMLSGSNAIPTWNKSVLHPNDSPILISTFKVMIRPNFVLNWHQYNIVATYLNNSSDDDSFDC